MKSRFALPLAGTLVLASALITAPPFQAPAQETSAQDAPAQAPAWRIDPAHSSLVFNVSHYGVAYVWGRFNTLQGTIHFDPDNLEGSHIHVTVDVASVDTNQNARDNHLRTSDFFHVEENPKAEFKSSKIEKAGDDTYKVMGEMSLMGHSKPFEFTYVWHGTAEDNRGNTRTGGTTEFKMDRIAWGVGQPGGGIGHEVTVHVSLEAIKQ